LEKLTNFFILDGKKSKSEFSIYKVVQMLYLFSKLNIVKYKLLIDKFSLYTTKLNSIRNIKNKIYCMENPIKLIKSSISTIKPYVHIVNLPYGRKTRIVPSPIPLRKQLKYALRWIKEGSLNIKLNAPLHIKILICLVNTYYRKGSAYNKYLEIHNQAFDNRAYINYNYQLRSKGTKKPNKDLYVYHSLKS
jgi:ribosomal protein S7